MYELLIITMLNGEQAHVAPHHIVSVTEARSGDDPGKHYAKEVKCVITLTTGRSISTAEDCDSVEARLREIRR
jgi:uncharacterized protein YlzI (FlbEa/FlbD family)